MRTVDSWFTFEGRCMLCGQKVGLSESMVGGHRHLELHQREGYLNEDLEQIKPHPVGFPGPPLGEQPKHGDRIRPPTSPAPEDRYITSGLGFPPALT